MAQNQHRRRGRDGIHRGVGTPPSPAIKYTTYWLCFLGQYPQRAKSGGANWKHTRQSAHPTVGLRRARNGPSNTIVVSEDQPMDLDEARTAGELIQVVSDVEVE